MVIYILNVGLQYISNIWKWDPHLFSNNTHVLHIETKQVIVVSIFAVRISTNIVLRLGGLLKYQLGFHVHFLKSLEHVVAEVFLCLNKVLHCLDVLRVGVDGGADV